MFLLFCYQIVISSYSVKRGLPELWERASTSSRTAPFSLPLRWTTSSLTKWQADVRKLLAGNVERGFTFFFILLFLLNENISSRISLGGWTKKPYNQLSLKRWLVLTLVGTGCGTCAFVLAPSQDSKCLQYHNICHWADGFSQSTLGMCTFFLFLYIFL